MSDRTRLRAFLAMCQARLREYYREPDEDGLVLVREALEDRRPES